MKILLIVLGAVFVFVILCVFIANKEETKQVDSNKESNFDNRLSNPGDVSNLNNLKEIEKLKIEISKLKEENTILKKKESVFKTIISRKIDFSKITNSPKIEDFAKYWVESYRQIGKTEDFIFPRKERFIKLQDYEILEKIGVLMKPLHSMSSLEKGGFLDCNMLKIKTLDELEICVLKTRLEKRYFDINKTEEQHSIRDKEIDSSPKTFSNDDTDCFESTISLGDKVKDEPDSFDSNQFPGNEIEES